MALLRRQAGQGQALPLHLDAPTFRTLLKLQGPSLGLWRAAEIAALREQVYGERQVYGVSTGEGERIGEEEHMAYGEGTGEGERMVSGESMAPARGATTNLGRPILDLGCGDGLGMSQ